MPIKLKKPEDARTQMPEITEFIDALRDSFGRDTIDDSIRRELRSGSFWAIEGEFVVGNPPEKCLREHEDVMNRQLE